MFNKKASSQVDWAISIGIFVVAILLLFIFLRPGVEPEQSPLRLFKDIETNLNKNAMYSISQYVLFIRPKPDPDFFPPIAGDYQLGIEDVDFPFEDHNPKSYALILDNRTYMPFEIEFDKGAKSLDGLRFNASLEGYNKNYFYILLYSLDYVYNQQWYKDGKRLLYKPCVTGGQNCVANPDIVNFTYEFGVKEGITGFSLNKLKALPDYNSLKSGWKFPSGREFSLVVTDLASNEVFKSINANSVPEDINVFSNTYFDWLVYPNTTLVPVNVTVMIW